MARLWTTVILLFTVLDVTLGIYCGLNPESPFRPCSCNQMDKNRVEIRCSGQNWLSIPSLDRVFSLEDRMSLKIQKLIFDHNAIAFLAQDSFQDQEIDDLQLPFNNIANINVNAFRSLEEYLKSLDLQSNSLTNFPYWAFTYLQKLQYLKLQSNQISEIAPNSSIKTQMNSLQFLHLDRNKLKRLDQGALSGFPLNVLTLSKNMIEQIEEKALPTALAILDLAGNLMEEIPFNALRELQLLQQLDLNSNRIRLTNSPSQIFFKNEIKLNLANNRIQQLDENSFASFARIKYLDLDMNQIDYIDGKAFANVTKLESLSLRFNNIKSIDLNAFGHLAKTLRRLNLAYNELDVLPKALQTLLSLESLELQNNRLTKLDDQLLVNYKHTLKTLRLDFNRLTSLESENFEGMQRLEDLDVSNNRITSLGRMTFGSTNGAAGSLKRLSLAGNRIEEITDPGSFLYFTSLSSLNLSFNRLRKITTDAFSRLSSLRSLDLKNNEFKEFPKSALYNLKKMTGLEISHNNIEDLPVRMLELSGQLSELQLAWNKIKVINDQIFHASTSQRLKWLCLANNEISEIGSDAFEDLPQLSHLDLHSNKLKHINPQTFSNLPELKYLNAERNKISTLHDFSFNQIPQLSFLSLAYNQLSKIGENSFQNVTRLQHLSLAHNLFKVFDFGFLGNEVGHLTALDLSYNKLSAIDLASARHALQFLSLRHNDFEFVDSKLLAGCGGLRSLDLSLNSIMEIHVEAFHKAVKLQQLDLHGNQLSTLWRETFSNQEVLESLDLSHNFITAIEPGTFGRENLVRLRLSHNNLSSIPTKAFTSVRRSLIELDISTNALRTIDKNDFQGLEKLERLILANNGIESIEANAFEELTRLTYLDLSGNPITTWNPHAFQGVSHVLQTLNLASTGLFSLPRIVTKSLAVLNISRNKIYEIHEEEIGLLSKLEVLDLSDNNIKELDSKITERLTQLKDLRLSGNRIRRLDGNHLAPLSQLETLHVSRMPDLVRLPDPAAFSHLSQLQNLHLYEIPRVANYNITSVLKRLPPLHSLHFHVDSETLHKQLHEVDLRLINELVVTGKQLKFIDSYALQGVRRFKLRLVIRGTSINDIPASLFDNMNSIRFLDLRLPNNQIETLEGLFKHGRPPVLNEHGTILEFLDLQGNPLVCDCRMSWLSEWIEHMSKQPEIWPDVRHALAWSKCTDRPGGEDGLLNLYDTTDTQLHEFRRLAQEGQPRRHSVVHFFKASTAFDCRKRPKEGIGFASFFFSPSSAHFNVPATSLLLWLLVTIT